MLSICDILKWSFRKSCYLNLFIYDIVQRVVFLRVDILPKNPVSTCRVRIMRPVRCPFSQGVIYVWWLAASLATNVLRGRGRSCLDLDEPESSNRSECSARLAVVRGMAQHDSRWIRLGTRRVIARMS